METVLEPIHKLRRDIKSAAVTLSDDEARFLVDYYYIVQEDRKRANNQERAMANEPHAVISWLAEQSRALENTIKGVLGVYAAGRPAGRWAQSITGIGPVISAGLLAHIDITEAPTVGHIWRYAGLDPTQSWNKGEKRPWNASLKTLCWKIGESFVKVSNNDRDIYGHVYVERKEQEIAKNEAGEFAEQAAAKLAKFKIGKDTDAYKAYSIGKLPPAHIHARAKRYAVKLFLSHFHEAMYREACGKRPPLPYIIEHGGHTHFIAMPDPEGVFAG